LCVASCQQDSHDLLDIDRNGPLPFQVGRLQRLQPAQGLGLLPEGLFRGRQVVLTQLGERDAAQVDRREALRRRMLSLILVAGVLVVAAVAATGCSTASAPTPAPATQQTAPAPAAEATTPAPAATIPDVTELKIKDLTVGKGATAKAGDTVTVNYTGWLTDGKQFDTSYGKAPFPFVLGAGDVIVGWDKGVAGMKVGGKRELLIPPALGYGAQGAGADIPPNATLRFEVELLGVTPPAK